MANNGFKTLKKDDAIALWKKGKDEWNKWVEKNPDYNIDFSGTDFSEFEKVDFSEFYFPNGVIDFSVVNFENAYVDFSRAKFGDGNVVFSGTKFKNGEVSFIDTEFGNGFVNFFVTDFGNGDVLFIGSKFGKGSVSFLEAKFGSSNVDFSGVVFNGSTIFKSLKNLSKVRSFSFQGAAFEGSLLISSEEVFPCLVDLTHTKTSHHVSLAGLKCELPTEDNRQSLFFDGDWVNQRIAKNPEDQDKARRLKEIAESNQHHEKAKEFQIMEMQAKRRHKYAFGWAHGYIFTTEFWYEKLSNYGSSIKKPFKWLVGVWLMWAVFYMGACGFKKIADPFIYSATQMVPFLPSSRGIREEIGKGLFEDMPWVFDAATLTQNLFAFILLFLLGLGLRFRYRI